MTERKDLLSAHPGLPAALVQQNVQARSHRETLPGDNSHPPGNWAGKVTKFLLRAALGENLLSAVSTPFEEAIHQLDPDRDFHLVVSALWRHSAANCGFPHPHGHVTDTYWYVTGTPELMAAAGERFEKRWEGFE